MRFQYRVLRYWCTKQMKECTGFFLWAFISALRYLPLPWLTFKLYLLRYRIYDNQSQNTLIVSRGRDRLWLQEDSCVREICLLPSYWHSRACQVFFLVMNYKFCSPNANITCILRDSLIARRNGLSLHFLFLGSVFSSDRNWVRWWSVDNSDSRSTDQGSIAEKHRKVRVLTLFHHHVSISKASSRKERNF